MTLSAPVPSPRELSDLAWFDPFDPAVAHDPWPAVAALSRDHWALMSPTGVLFLRYEDCQRALKDPDFEQASELLLETEARRQGVDDTSSLLTTGSESILTSTGDRHLRLRRLVAAAFTPRAVDRLRPVARSVADALLDELTERTDVEFVSSFSRRFTIPIICHVLGAPVADADRIDRWADDLIRVMDLNFTRDLPAVRNAQREFDEYVRQLIRAKQEQPSNDLLSALVSAEVDGARLDIEDCVMLAEAMLLAGTDTTRNQLATTMWALARDEQRWAALRANPELVPGAVQESLRLHGVVTVTSRVVVRETSVNGLCLPVGTIIRVFAGAASRDPDVYPNPDRFDMTRPPAGAPMTFGGGAHFCLGAHLARVELEEALTAIVQRWQHVQLLSEPAWRPSAGVGGPLVAPPSRDPVVLTAQSCCCSAD